MNTYLSYPVAHIELVLKGLTDGSPSTISEGERRERIQRCWEALDHRFGRQGEVSQAPSGGYSHRLVISFDDIDKNFRVDDVGCEYTGSQLIYMVAEKLLELVNGAYGNSEREKQRASKSFMVTLDRSEDSPYYNAAISCDGRVAERMEVLLLVGAVLQELQARNGNSPEAYDDLMEFVTATLNGMPPFGDFDLRRIFDLQVREGGN